jgi:hypothetical protein
VVRVNIDDLPGMVPGTMTVKGWTDPRQAIVDMVGTWFTLGSSVHHTGDAFITVDYVAPDWRRADPDGTVTLTVIDGPPVTGVVIALEQGAPPQAFVHVPTPLFPGDTYVFRPADLIDWSA